MDEQPALALREKKDSSILVAVDLVKNGQADAVVTAGHTGAGMAAAVLRLGRLPGVDRPALAVQMITAKGPVVLLDIGANPDSTPENLVQYARMGAIFAERVLGVAEPRVALLSIGEEKGKGDARIQRATELLDETDLHFEGNVEGKDLTTHMADVVVCDAVLGNVVIKFFEGLSTYIFDLWRAEFSGSLRGRLAYLLMRPSVGRIRGIFDYEKVGGSPLLGVRGTVIITHGRARRRMIAYGMEVAARTARTGVPALIAESLAASRQAGAARATAAGGHATRRGIAECVRGREPPRGGLMDGPELTVGRGVIAELVRLAAFEVPGVLSVGRGGPAWRRLIGGPSVVGQDPQRACRRPAVARGSSRPGARSAHGCRALDGRRHRRARPRSRARDGHRPGRRCRGLTASAAGGRAGGSPSRRSSRRTSASAPPMPSSSVTSPRRSGTRTPPRWRASSWRLSSSTATGSTPRSAGARRSTRSPAWRGWTAHCSVAP